MIDIVPFFPLLIEIAADGKGKRKKLTSTGDLAAERWLSGSGLSNLGGTVCSVMLTESTNGSRPDSERKSLLDQLY